MSDSKQVQPVELVSETLMRIGDLAKVAPRSEALRKKEKEKESSAESANKSNGTYYFAKGTGYGNDDGTSAQWDFDGFVSEAQNTKKQISEACDALTSVLKEHAECRETTEKLLTALTDSCLLPFLAQYIYNDSIIDIEHNRVVYDAVLALCKLLAETASLSALLQVPVTNGSKRTLARGLKTLAGLSERVNKVNQEAAKKLLDAQVAAVSDKDKDKPSEEDQAAKKEEDDFCEAFLKQLTFVASVKEAEAQSSEKQEEEKKELDDAKQREELYMKLLADERFAESSKFDHFHFDSAKNDVLTRKTIRRLAAEFCDLAQSLPLTWDSSIFMRAHAEDMSKVQMLVLAPDNTPYGYGAFLFDLKIPGQYPQGPPKLNLQTTGGGTVRFNPNLYDSGYVCLSLLGTWGGSQGETWSPDTSTLLQLAVSVQSLIFVPEPYFNEPSYESSIGTESGDNSSRSYNRNIRLQSMKWAMIDMLKKPPHGFEKVIQTHFYLRKDDVLAQCKKWLDEDAGLEKTYAELKECLDALAKPF